MVLLFWWLFLLPSEDGILEDIISRLRAIPHVEIVRIGSQPGGSSTAYYRRFVNMFLRSITQFIKHFNFNHSNEVIPESVEACAISHRGVPLGNQSVLLRGALIVRNVMKKLVRAYNLLACVFVLTTSTSATFSMGLEHFRTPVSKGIEIIESLRTYLRLRCSNICG